MENQKITVQNRREGNLNPMWGHKQTSVTKKKISDSQKARYAAIRKAIQEKEDIVDYGRTDMAARKDVLLQLLDRNQLSFQSVQQAANFFAIMLDEERVKRIVQEQIDKFLAKYEPIDKRHL